MELSFFQVPDSSNPKLFPSTKFTDFLNQFISISEVRINGIPLYERGYSSYRSLYIKLIFIIHCWLNIQVEANAGVKQRLGIVQCKTTNSAVDLPIIKLFVTCCNGEWALFCLHLIFGVEHKLMETLRGFSGNDATQWFAKSEHAPANAVTKRLVAPCYILPRYEPRMDTPSDHATPI